MKIAIIGSGISGLTCAHHLHKNHQITLFEAQHYVGGHAATVDVKTHQGNYAIDTGFIVFNDRTYPHFCSLLKEIGISAKPTQMSFSVRNEQNALEYNGHTLTSLFAQKSNVFKPRFYAFIAEILRFNQLARKSLQHANMQAQTLGDFLCHHKFSPFFCQNYILPMGAAIWSSSIADIRNFPLRFFLQFFSHHGLLEVTNRPQWYVIEGGSREYVKKLIAPFQSCVRLNTPVNGVIRHSQGVILKFNGKTEHFDQVIFACHSDQALKMLRNPSTKEQEILSNMPYQKNEVILHSDIALLPIRKKAWASWNYHLAKTAQLETQPTTLTYNMNILQRLVSNHTFCVSLNQSASIDANKIIDKFNYSHPVFTENSLTAQKKRAQINGKNHSWYCGAYWYNGFHEDGVRSALDVVQALQANQNLSSKEVLDVK